MFSILDCIYSPGFPVVLTQILITVQVTDINSLNIHLNSVTVFFQNPIVVIMPKEKTSSTRRTKNEFQAIFPDTEDIGKCIDSYNFYVVFNNRDHYCSTKKFQANFQDTIATMFDCLSFTQSIGSLLLENVEENSVKKSCRMQMKKSDLLLTM